MPANTSPVFSLTPNCKTVAGTATANTNRDGSGTIFDIITGGTNGTRVEGVTFTSVGTVSAGVVRVYHKVSSTYYLIAELLVTATTPSTSVSVAQYSWKPSVVPFVLTSGDKLSFSTNEAVIWNATPIAGDF